MRCKDIKVGQIGNYKNRKAEMQDRRGYQGDLGIIRAGGEMNIGHRTSNEEF